MTDLIILGNGMAGMTAALYAKRANLNFKIIGKDEFDFGQIGNAILVENYPCSESLSGFELATKLHDQLLTNSVEIEEHTVKKVIYKNDGTFLIEYEDGTIDHSKTVVYALGATPRQLNCKIDEDISIHYCALCDGSLYKNKTVAVIGGGDSAFTQAEYLSKICENVYIVMCDNNITANKSLETRIKNINNIQIIFNSPINYIRKKNNKYLLTPFEKEENKLYSLYGITVDGVFVSIGMKPNTNPIEHFLFLENGYIYSDEYCATSVPGFFAAGDVRTKQLRQSITAAADGANAIQSVINYLNLERVKNENK